MLLQISLLHNLRVHSIVIVKSFCNSNHGIGMKPIPRCAEQQSKLQPNYTNVMLLGRMGGEGASLAKEMENVFLFNQV